SKPPPLQCSLRPSCAFLSPFIFASLVWSPGFTRFGLVSRLQPVLLSLLLLHEQKNQLRFVLVVRDSPGRKRKCSRADSRHVSLNFKILELIALDQQVLEQGPQLLLFPTSVTQLVNQSPFHFFTRHQEQTPKPLMGNFHFH